ncbi:MAG: monovalent cation/H(+) antiporter subunit G [Rhodospirillales bacterium]|nr:monovalent cation/H(+) antiporter subunit G [Rhodospirillales bacterium]
MVDIAGEILSWFLLVGGGLFVFIGGVGMLRLPDFYTRIHAASITDTLGAGMILGGLMVQSETGLVTIKLVLILFFIFFTSPTSTHALVKAALFSGVRPVVSKKGSGKKSLAPARALSEPSNEVPAPATLPETPGQKGEPSP